MLGHYLMFDRCCAEALEVYANAFDAEITEKQTYGELPSPGFPVAEADKDLILHARIVIDGAEIMCADSSGGSGAGNNMYISVTVKDMEAVQKAWDALAEGGEVYMALAPSFFAAAHGSLRDRFGVNWMFTVPNN